MQVARNTNRGVELGYAETTSGTTSTTTNTYEDLSGLAVTVTVGSRPIVITAFLASVSHSASSGNILARIFEGTTALNTSFFQSGTASIAGQVKVMARVAPSAGSHTYKVAWASQIAGTHTFTASSSVISFIQVIEV